MSRRWQYKRRKLKGAFGMTDYAKHTIFIDKARHRKAKKNKRLLGNVPQKDNTIINTIVHERLHMNHPRMLEKTIRKMARRRLKHMSPSMKQKLYSKVK